jgi:hypothetical protein
VVVRYGDPGTPDYPKAATFVAQQVIDDLSPVLPDPSAKH